MIKPLKRQLATTIFMLVALSFSQSILAKTFIDTPLNDTSVMNADEKKDKKKTQDEEKEPDCE